MNRVQRRMVLEVLSQGWPTIRQLCITILQVLFSLMGPKVLSVFQ